MKIIFDIFFSCLALSANLTGASIILNQGFEDGLIAPWYQDRSFGTYRSWTVGQTTPHDGVYQAFCLGRIELRQDFTAVIGSRLTDLSFYGMHQLANLGNPWVELFYDNGTTSGQIEILLDPSHSYEISHQRIWDKFDLLPYVNKGLAINGISFIGIPNNTFIIDSVNLTTVPEPTSVALIALGACLLTQRRRVVQQGMACNPQPRSNFNPAASPRPGACIYTFAIKYVFRALHRISKTFAALGMPARQLPLLVASASPSGFLAD